MTRDKGPEPRKTPKFFFSKTPSGKSAQNSHSETEGLLEMSLTATEHGSKDLEQCIEAFA